MANESRAYREVLAGTLAELHPRLLVHLLEPTALDETTRRLCPELVICSQVSPVLRDHAAAWLRLPARRVEPAESETGAGGRACLAADLAMVLAVLDAALDPLRSVSHSIPEHRPTGGHHAS